MPSTALLRRLSMNRKMLVAVRFRRVNRHLQLGKLRAALEAQVAALSRRSTTIRPHSS
jgi:hypothetical protein